MSEVSNLTSILAILFQTSQQGDDSFSYQITGILFFIIDFVRYIIILRTNTQKIKYRIGKREQMTINRANEAFY